MARLIGIFLLLSPLLLIWVIRWERRYREKMAAQGKLDLSSMLAATVLELLFAGLAISFQIYIVGFFFSGRIKEPGAGDIILVYPLILFLTIPITALAIDRIRKYKKMYGKYVLNMTRGWLKINYIIQWILLILLNPIIFFGGGLALIFGVAA